MYTTIRQVRASDKPRSGASPQWLKVDHVQLAMPVGGEADARSFYADVRGFVHDPFGNRIELISESDDAP